MNHFTSNYDALLHQTRTSQSNKTVRRGRPLPWSPNFLDPVESMELRENHVSGEYANYSEFQKNAVIILGQNKDSVRLSSDGQENLGFSLPLRVKIRSIHIKPLVFSQ